MFKILDKNKDINNVYTMKIMAPRVAKSIKPGQFIILRIDEKGERIPFSVCDYNAREGYVTIVFRVNSSSVEQLANMNIGDNIIDFVGPMGQASFLIKENIEELKAKNILFVTDGLAAARIYPEVSWLSSNDISSDVLINFDTYSEIVFKKKIEDIAGKVVVSTVDGSKGIKGDAAKAIKSILEGEKKYDIVIAIGATEMMRDVSVVTKEYNVKTIVSLTTLMLDGTGMCGGCRLTIGGSVKFACQDGPEFDGHLVDYEEVIRRQNFYATYESKLKYRKEHGSCNHSINEVTTALEAE
ncbi:sulfide/dihydroorotate dehydrogenase-like FAD/NAD-binding protein [Clostridium arbusti]|uniref:sulfide/dihydroorotate dehydrogenase-like FAD/NAD-binding protein n=1 Tax=Clostridium arbusti TaxID=1137848 RepID=UPI00028934C5|nr:sulfide/dihydroorotate dehydrogenase-like FAD/NAD-binding protein [Clostridium arbusti]